MRTIIMTGLTLNQIESQRQSDHPDGFTLHLVLPPNPASNTRLPTLQRETATREQGSHPQIRAPQPLGLPSPPVRLSFPPPRPASTGQLPATSPMSEQRSFRVDQAPAPMPLSQEEQDNYQNSMDRIQRQMESSLGFMQASLDQMTNLEGRSTPGHSFHGHPMGHAQGSHGHTSHGQPTQNQFMHGQVAQSHPTLDHHHHHHHRPHGPFQPMFPFPAFPAMANSHGSPGPQNPNILPPGSQLPFPQPSHTPDSRPFEMRNPGPFSNESPRIGNLQQPGVQHDTGSNTSSQTQTNSTPNQGSTIVREGNMPGGQWRMVINQSTIPVAQSPAPQNQNQRHTATMSPFLRNNIAGQSPINHGPSQPPSTIGGDAFGRLQQLAVTAATTLPPTYSDSTVYLLSSPTGPEALLISPAGTFASPNFPGTSSIPIPPPAVVDTRPQTRAPPFQNLVRATPPNAPGAPPGAPPPAAVPNQDVAAQPNHGGQVPEDPIAEILRLLLPLGGHLWLLVRLFGFVWLLTSGTPWHRTVLVGIGAVLVFIAQTGAFQPLIELIWTPLRRHMEGLIQVDNHGRGRPNDQAATGTPAADTRQTRPQDMADRLLRERAATRENSLLWATIRRAERAIALFVASLVPGVGERHIAAQDAAAREARARDQAEREEALRRERESEVTGEEPEERQVQPVL